MPPSYPKSLETGQGSELKGKLKLPNPALKTSKPTSQSMSMKLSVEALRQLVSKVAEVSA